MWHRKTREEKDMASVEKPLYGRHQEKGKTWPIQVCYADRLAIPVADVTIPGKLSYTVYTIEGDSRRFYLGLPQKTLVIAYWKRNWEAKQIKIYSTFSARHMQFQFPDYVQLTALSQNTIIPVLEDPGNTISRSFLHIIIQINLLIQASLHADNPCQSLSRSEVIHFSFHANKN